jgi:predicted unusual protein kinase regulating ubiquinone biosynthesis (AarF/ABC1/UbiB family)
MTTAVTDSHEELIRGRYRQILWFFARVISHLVWWDLLVGRIFKGAVRRSRPKRFRRMSRRFRVLAVEMGGVLIKLGQFLSARVDVLPPEITEELAGLQDEVPPVPFPEIESVLEAELGDIATHFAYFDTNPLAAASLGQAHRGWLAPADSQAGSGRPRSVVVKVQRPGIEDIVTTDLAALQVVARWAMRYRPIRRRADIPALMDEFAATLWEELDYVSEADNAERFAEMFAENEDVRIPAVYRQHSTRRVLVLEDVSGIKITDVDAIAAAGVDPREVAVRVLDAYFQQIFKEGFFHADPHPGNLFIQPLDTIGWQGGAASRPFRLAFVDFGMVGHIERLMGDNLRKVLVSITQRDAWGLTQAYNDLGFFLPGADLDRIAEAQSRVLDQIWGRNLLELSQPDRRELQELSSEFRDLLFEFPFQVPQDFIFLGRAFGMLSGLASLLDPGINPWHLLEQYGREIVLSQEGLEMSLSAIAEWLRMFISLPSQLHRVLAAAESGRLRGQSGSDRALLRRLDRLDRRLSRPNWSLMAAALLLSGTLLYLNDEVTLGAISWAVSAIFFLLSLLGRN